MVHETTGIFVRGGSILPILGHHRELSLLQALQESSIDFRVFLDREMYAAGRLYLDDGRSLDSEGCELELKF